LKKIYLLFICLCLPYVVEAVTEDEKFWEKESLKNIPKGFGIHTDLGYSTYLIELHSSEMDSAIDYDVLETTLGLSYVNDNILVGIYGKFVVDEIQSNMYVVTTQAPLNNRAEVTKDEFALYLNYFFLESEKSSWSLNTIYRYASLDASDRYNSFFNYVSYFKYKTDGLALSLAYQRELLRGMVAINLGMLYSKAKVTMSESIDGQIQDTFVNDSVNALGSKFSLAYKYEYSENLSFHLRTDFWRQKFGSLNVSSLVGDSLPNASLREESYTTYLGVAWRF